MSGQPKCSRCGIRKPSGAFRRSSLMRGRKTQACRECLQEQERRRDIRKRMQHEHFRCAVCGEPLRILSHTHLRRHGLTKDKYIQRFGLPETPAQKRLREAWVGKGLGGVPDSVIAEREGVPRRTVCAIRRNLGIQAFRGTILTQEGKPTRSIYEAKYDAWLHWRGVGHEHEVPVPGLPYIADFRVGGVFIEIAGMEGFGRYDAKLKRKQEAYLNFGIRVSWLTRDLVDRLFQDCPVPLRFRERTCSHCGKAIHDLVNGMCRQCNRKSWGMRNAVRKTCEQCGKAFNSPAGQSNQRFCSRPCYWESLEGAWPSWDELDARLQGKSIRQVALELGVKPPTLYKRLRRRKQ